MRGYVPGDWVAEADFSTLERVNGRLILSSGLYRGSKIGVLNLDTGRLGQPVPMPDDIFAEGLTATPEGIWLLSWKEQEARLLDADTLELLRIARYDGEGWGLCYDGEKLYMSDGSSWLSIRDPVSFNLLDRVQVREGGQPMPLINELEYAEGLIYANLWLEDRILRIDPADGQVLASYDMSSLREHALPAEARRGRELNGIAHIEDDRFYVTGKGWPRLYEVRLP